MQKWFILSLLTLFIAISFSFVAAASLQDGLIVYYPFDEAAGTTASDVSGNKNHAELVGNAAWAPGDGKIGGAIKFDGSDSSVVDEDGGDYINGLEAFSISVWVKSDSVGHDRGIVFGKDPTGGDDVFGLRYDSSSWATKGGTNVIKGAITTTGGGQAFEGKSDVQTTEWQHLVFTWTSGEKLALYVDGELDNEPTHNDDSKVGTISGATKLIVGKGAKDGSASWTGLIDDFHLYNRMLKDGEIADLASGQNVTPVEARGKLTTVWGSLKRN